MSDIQVELKIKIKNRLLYDAIMGVYPNIMECARDLHKSIWSYKSIHTCKLSLYMYVNMERVPSKRDADELAIVFGDVFSDNVIGVTDAIKGKSRTLDITDKLQRISLEGFDRVIDGDLLIEDGLHTDDIRETIKETLEETLPAREGDILSRYYIDGFNQAELAKKYGICPARVSTIISRGMKRLKHPSRNEKLRELYHGGKDFPKFELYRPEPSNYYYWVITKGARRGIIFKSPSTFKLENNSSRKKFRFRSEAVEFVNELNRSRKKTS